MAKHSESEGAIKKLITLYLYAAMEDEDSSSDKVFDATKMHHTSKTILSKKTENAPKLKNRFKCSTDVAQIWDQIFIQYCREIASLDKMPESINIESLPSCIESGCEEPIGPKIIKFGQLYKNNYGSNLREVVDATDALRASMIKYAPNLVTQKMAGAVVALGFDCFLKSFVLFIARSYRYNTIVLNNQLTFGVLRIADIPYQHIDNFNENLRPKASAKATHSSALAEIMAQTELEKSKLVVKTESAPPDSDDCGADDDDDDVESEIPDEPAPPPVVIAPVAVVPEKIAEQVVAAVPEKKKKKKKDATS